APGALPVGFIDGVGPQLCLRCLHRRARLGGCGELLGDDAALAQPVSVAICCAWTGVRATPIPPKPAMASVVASILRRGLPPRCVRSANPILPAEGGSTCQSPWPITRAASCCR